LFMEDNQDALNYGIRPVKVYILDWYYKLIRYGDISEECPRK
jgi:hypothetical protein